MVLASNTPYCCLLRSSSVLFIHYGSPNAPHKLCIRHKWGRGLALQGKNTGLSDRLTPQKYSTYSSDETVLYGTVRHSTPHSPISYRSPYQSTPTINPERPPPPPLPFLSRCISQPLTALFLSLVRSFVCRSGSNNNILLAAHSLSFFLSLFMIYILRTFIRSFARRNLELLSIDYYSIPSDSNEAYGPV